VVYEFAGRREHMMHSLLEGLGALRPGLRVTPIGGVFLTYKQGGYRPERLINLVWVYVAAALHLVFCRPDAVLVHSSPPGIQLWTAAWASIGRIPVFCWLMDYHPEIEARGLEKRGWIRAARILREIDGRLMPRFAAIVTLDPAMTALVRQHAPYVDVLEHPTWTLGPSPGVNPVSYAPGSGAGPLRLVYTGNLGLTHDLLPLANLLEAIQRRREVVLHVVGSSRAGEARFREMGARVGAAVEVRPRVPLFSDLGVLYERLRIDAGIVVLSVDSIGLVSPSKFVGYVDFGLPLVYLGPAGTNSARVCLEFKGGFWLPPNASSTETEDVAARLLDENQMASAANGALAAARYFHGFNGRTLAALLAPRLKTLAPMAPG
jgi:colanic acid biosynthesis glycosyl transferase WcaI